MRKAYSDSLIFNPVFNEYAIYHDNEYYKRIKNMMKKWKLSILDSAKLIINVELEQTLPNNEENLSKNMLVIQQVNFIKNIMTKEKSRMNFPNNRRLNRSISHS